jgi:hypothetical protein
LCSYQQQYCCNSCTGHYKTSPALGEQKESKRSTSPRAVFGTATRAGQEKVRSMLVWLGWLFASKVECTQCKASFKETILLPPAPVTAAQN